MFLGINGPFVGEVSINLAVTLFVPCLAHNVGFNLYYKNSLIYGGAKT